MMENTKAFYVPAGFSCLQRFKKNIIAESVLLHDTDSFFCK